MKKNALILTILIWTGFTAHAAETGKPFMTVFPSKETGGHVQNWAIVQDSRGVMYFGDGFGIQEYDGSTWRLIQSPNESFARSFAIDADGRIYVGSSGMLGYLASDDHGSMRYVSLLDCIKPEDRIFNYVWSVQTTPEGIYFQTRERLFRFSRATVDSDSKNPSETWHVKVWKPRGNFAFTFWVDQTLFVHQSDIGLTRMAGDSLVPIPEGGQFASDRMQVMLPFPGKPGSYLFGTFNRGLFAWDGKTFRPFRTDSDDSLRSGTLYTGVGLPDGCLALGTMSNGLFIIDPSGRTKMHLTLDNGLPSNTVSALFVDRQKNLWAGMDGGTAVLEYDSPLSQFDLPSGSSPQDFCRYRGILYAAANTGVPYLDSKDSQFKFISGITGNAQSFYFGSIGNDLFITTGSAIYRIDGHRAVLAERANTIDYVYLAIHQSRQNRSIILGALTSGVSILLYDAHEPNRLRYLGRVAGVYEYIRYMVEPEPGTLWLSPSDAGPIRLTFSGDSFTDPKVERFGPSNGLPDGGIVICQTVRGPVFCTKRGVYTFDAEKRTFSPDPFYRDVGLGRNPDEGVVVSDQDGNIWANLGRETVLYKKQPDGTYRMQKDLLSRFSDDPAISIYPEKDGNVWFGTTNYAIRLTQGKTTTEHAPFPALIRSVSFANDSIVYHGTPAVPNRPENPAGRSIPFRFNALRFDFSTTSFINPRANEFRTRLEGFDKTWSTWRRETRRDYTNLPSGKYRFLVQARNINNQESEQAVYAFSITHPWYNTWWAYLGYALFAGGFVFGLVRMRTRQLQERSRALEKTVQERTAQIQEQKNNVEQLSIIGRDITDNLSIKDIINTVYVSVNTLMEASVFGIGLCQENEQTLVFPATKEKSATLPEFSIPLSDENRLAVWCFKNRKDVVINDYGRDYSKYIKQLQAAMAGENPESILYLPLQHKDRTIGVITAQSFKKNAYTEYHVNMLRNLATYCAIALENADAYRRVNKLVTDLKSTQEKLVTQSKLAALGALTAGIAHEIKNPLNFVNNFAELTKELAVELNQEIAKNRDKLDPADLATIEELLSTLQQNAGKIKEHGGRADSIVRSMLQHSRGKAGERQPTDINAVLEEDIHLAYHGMRAQDSSFNIKIETDLDKAIGKLDVVPQDISRVFLNIISNACYEANRKKTTAPKSFEPLLTVRSIHRKDGIEVRIRDNGLGIPEAIRDKLFTPFFTTKPAGQGTGLGLSISYDIVVHEHHGELFFESKEGEYTEFIIRLNRKTVTGSNQGNRS